MFSPPQLLPDLSHLPKHPTCSFSLSLSLFQQRETKTKQESKRKKKNSVRQKMPKQSKMKLKVHRNATEFFLCCPTTPGHGARPVM